MLQARQAEEAKKLEEDRVRQEALTYIQDARARIKQGQGAFGATVKQESTHSSRSEKAAALWAHITNQDMESEGSSAWAHEVMQVPRVSVWT